MASSPSLASAATPTAPAWTSVYDVKADPQGIVRDNPGANNWERAIQQAGFDGYTVRHASESQG
ncbi:hypothetical protein QN397_23705 [Variovorax sp. RTB1]|uniref:hypothetical protein n=1 Tax=Variovorax sp. RTB1 TaxID=3048631 RepID=UPI002B222B1F|nr:hypothetical protein [Variovorax sp. RTB1]MEB0114289.1 hypothetical protein [Variovorax sp. RTB1]